MKRIISIVFAVLLISAVNVLACGGSCRGGGSCRSNDSCGGGSCSCRDKQGTSQQNVTTANTEEVVKKYEVGNKICPIEGKKITSMSEAVNVEYESIIYNLCGAKCIKKFEKNPQKYSKITEREVANKAMK